MRTLYPTLVLIQLRPPSPIFIEFFHTAISLDCTRENPAVNRHKEIMAQYGGSQEVVSEQPVAVVEQPVAVVEQPMSFESDQDQAEIVAIELPPNDSNLKGTEM